MKNYLVAAIILSCFAFAKEDRQIPVFDRLYVLEGKWVMKIKKGFVVEEWTKVDKDYLQSRKLCDQWH